jgi:hypothetical protein
MTSFTSNAVGRGDPAIEGTEFADGVAFNGTCRFFWLAADATVTFTTEKGSSITAVALKAGYHPISCTSITATGSAGVAYA